MSLLLAKVRQGSPKTIKEAASLREQRRLLSEQEGFIGAIGGGVMFWHLSPARRRA
jgi:hypothetical protein